MAMTIRGERFPSLDEMTLSDAIHARARLRRFGRKGSVRDLNLTWRIRRLEGRPDRG